MPTVTFDTLEFVETLEKAGIERAHASGIAAAVRAAQEAALSEHAKEANTARSRAVDSLDSKTENALLKLDSKIELLRKDMETMGQRLTIKMGSMFIVAVGVLLAAIKWMH